MNFHRIALITRKELRAIGAEKTIILAILLQLFIALFSSFLMVGLSAMYDPSAYGRVSGIQYGVGYAGNDTLLYELITRDGSFRPYQMDPGVALAALKERKLAAVVVLSDTPPGAEDPVTITLYTIKNDIQSAVIEVKLKDILMDYEKVIRDIRKDRLDSLPLSLTIARPVVSNTFYEFIFGLLIPMLLFMPAIISAGLVIDLITEEHQQQTLDTIRSTPVSVEELVFGKILACLILIPIQAGVWLLLLTINGIRISSIVEILLHVMAGSAVLILVASLTALWYRDRTKAQFIFSTATIILLLLALAFPYNPVNLIVLLATGNNPGIHWLVLLILVVFCLVLLAGVRIGSRRLETGS